MLYFGMKNVVQYTHHTMLIIIGAHRPLHTTTEIRNNWSINLLLVHETIAKIVAVATNVCMLT